MSETENTWFSVSCFNNSGPPDAPSLPHQQLGIGWRFWNHSTHLIIGGTLSTVPPLHSPIHLHRAWQRIDIARSILSSTGQRISSTNRPPHSTTTSLLETHLTRIPTEVLILEPPWQPPSPCRPSTTLGPAATAPRRQLAEAT